MTTIPYCVLGGATVSVFASIAMTGMKLITSQNMTFRNTSIVGLAAALGMGISQASDSLASFPDWFVMIFGKSPGCSGYIACSTPQHCTAQRQRRCKLICTFDSLSYITKMFPSGNPDGNIFAFYSSQNAILASKASIFIS